MRLGFALLAVMILAIPVIGIWGAIYSYTHPTKPTSLPEPKIQISKPTPTPQLLRTPEATSTATQSAMLHPIKEFIITATDFRFSPNSLTVKQNDQVNILFKNVKGLHNFSITEYGIFSPMNYGPQTSKIEFVADTKGEFTFYCGVEDHKQLGMMGKLVVE